MLKTYPFAQKKLMTPGPVPVPEYVKDIFANCHMHHRRPEFSEVLVRCLQNLKKVFQTDQHCFMLPATGTGAMEAALINLLSPGDSVLVINGGKFGERWQKLAKAYDLNADVMEVEWGEDLDLNQVAEKIKQSSPKALFVQACETSTGVAHPIAELGKLCGGGETLLVVDGITALAAYDVPMDQWGIDVLIGGSQKGFMLPTGMAFMSLSQKAWEKSKTAGFKKYYWDLTGELTSNQKGVTRYSTPVQFTLGLDQVLQDILEKQGLANYFATTLNRAKIFREKVDLPVFAKTPSPSLTSLRVPETIAATDIVARLFNDFNISIVAGQDQLKQKILRVGHMGYMSEQDLIETADAINQCVKEMSP